MAWTRRPIADSTPRRFAVALAIGLALAAGAGAAEPPAPPDEALDKLLEKLEGTKPAPPGPAVDPPKVGPDPTEPGPKAEPPKPKGEGEVSSKDQALDNLLEKLGETTETPAPDDPPKGAPKPGDPPKGAPKPGDPPKPTDPAMGGEADRIDRHLEDLTGRKRKEKTQEPEDEGSGPLGDVVKQMREVEKRLAEPDTGEQTRQKQTTIVKNLDTVLEQLRQSSSQSKSQLRKSKKPGPPKPGEPKPGNGTGTLAGGPPPAKPAKPTTKSILAGGKDAWGHLEEALRDEMANAAGEEALPSKEELIKLYYIALSKKATPREERPR